MCVEKTYSDRIQVKKEDNKQLSRFEEYDIAFIEIGQIISEINRSLRHRDFVCLHEITTTHLQFLVGGAYRSNM